MVANLASLASHADPSYLNCILVQRNLFLQVDDALPSIALNANESREILWGKTKLGFQVNKLFNLVSPSLSSSNLA